ncbi:MAG: cellulase family glycosylhydrolase [Treponema sp.]|nr:cellulase family glycosylhydrolase [Treponema sp.]
MKQFNGFMHGVNLGGWFSQCNHTNERYDNFITKEDFAVIKSWGLDHIRLPIDYNLVEQDDGSYKEKGFDRISQAISWCKANNLNLILDLHKTAGYSFDAGHGESGFFDSPALQERFYKLWEKLAAHFASSFDGSSNEICFELLNEVTDQSFCKKWNEIARTCIQRIRTIAPTIKILVGSYWNNAVSAVKDLDPPYDQNIVYNFHCYEPLLFTHQGAPWIAKMDTSFRMKFNTQFKEYKKLTPELCGQPGSNFDPFDPEAIPDASYFQSLFEEAIDVAEKRNVLLYCGEYGVIDRATPQDTIEWYKAISAIFNKYGIGRAAWSYRQMDFGLSDTRLDEARQELLKYL